MTEQAFQIGEKVVALGGSLRGAPNCRVTDKANNGQYEVTQSRLHPASGKVIKYSSWLYASQLQKV